MSFLDRLNSVLGLRENRSYNNNDIYVEERANNTPLISKISFGGGSSGYVESKAMKISAVYRCVNCITDAISQLPLEPFKVDKRGYKRKLKNNPLYKILNQNPNQRMTRATFLSLMVQSTLLTGNAYAYILRGIDGKVEQLIFIPSNYVTIISPKNIVDSPEYLINGINGNVKEKDLIHILNFSYDGVIGISTLAHAANTLGLAYDSEQHARNFFLNGASVGGYLKTGSSLNAEQKQKLKQQWVDSMGSAKGSTNSVAILSGDQEFKQITLSPEQSQLLASREFDVVSICRYFGVSPIKCFDLSHANYASSEAANLSFLTDTLQPILQKFELEFERKLFPNEEVDVRFDVTALLRSDKAGLSTYYREMFNLGALCINEIRKDLDLMPIEGGDTHFVQANLLSAQAAASNLPANSMIRTEENQTNENPHTEENEEEKPTEEE